MTTDAPAPANTILSIDQAAEALSAPAPKKRETAPPPQAEAGAEAQPPVEDGEDDEISEPSVPESEGDEEAEPEGATGDEEGEGETEDAEGEEPDQPEPLAPPQFWNAEEKETFRSLPRTVQETIHRHEQQRTAAAGKQIQEAAERRKAADSELTRLTPLLGALDSVLPVAVQTFKGKWEDVDWNEVVRQYGADQALILKNDMEREQALVQQLEAAKSEGEKLRYSQFVQAEAAKLSEICPDLVDAKHGVERRTKLGRFLVDVGIPAKLIPHMSALEASIAYDAMQWRQAKANATTKAPKPNEPAAMRRPSVRPTAAPSSRNPQSARIQALTSKKSLTVDEAVELANLRGN